MSDIRMTRTDDLDDTLVHDETTTGTTYSAGNYTTGTNLGFDRVSAVFDNRDDAERAVQWLRTQGVPDSAISIVSRHGDDYASTGDVAHHHKAREDAADAGKGALVGLGTGAGVGALFGLAAAAIPGVGPFIAAGWLANVLGVTGGLAAAGAIVGGTSGALAGALAQAGMDKDEAHYYAGEIERGATFVSVHTADTTMNRAAILEGLRNYGGRQYT